MSARASPERWRPSAGLAAALLGVAGDGVIVADAASREILAATDGAARLFGAASPEALVGLRPEILHPADVLSDVAMRFAEASSVPACTLTGVPYARLDGERFTAEVRTSVFEDDDGRACVAVVLTRDDPAGEGVRLREFVGSTPSSLGLFDASGALLAGGPGGALPGVATLGELAPPADRAILQEALSGVVRSSRAWIGAVALYRPGGTTTANHLVTLVPFVDPVKGPTVVALAHSTDEVLRDGRLARELVGGMSDGLLVADMETMRVVGANEAMARMVGVEVDDLLRSSVPDLHPAEGEWRAQFAAAAAGEVDRALAVPFLRKGGGVVHADLWIRGLSVDGANVMAAFVRPTVERLENAQLDSLLGQSDVFVGVARPDGELLVANRPPAPGIAARPGPVRLQDHVVETDQAELERALAAVRAGESVHATLACHTRDGVGHWAAILTPVMVGGEVVQMLVLATDVTERMALERRLREFVEGAPLVTYWLVADADGGERIEYVSPQMERWLGYPIDRWRGTREEVAPFLVSLVHPDDVDVFTDRLRAAAARETWSGEFRLKAADGTYRWGLESFSFLPAPDGSAVRVGFVLDVHERRRSQEAHETLTERFRSLVEASSDLIQSVGPDGRIVLVNDAWARRMGYTAEEAVGLELMELIHPDDRGHCGRLLERCLAGEALRGVEARLIARDGSVVEVRGTVAPVIQDGVVLSTNAFFDDVGARTAAERAERVFGTLAAASPDVFWLQDIGTGLVSFVGEQVAALTGVLPQAIEDDAEAWYGFVHADDRDRARDTFHAWRLDGAREPLTVEYRFVRPDGSLAWMRDSARGIVDADGVRRVIAGIASDITTERLERATFSGWTHDAIVVVDGDDRVVRWNTGAAELFGRLESEALGESVGTIVADADRAALLRHVAAARDGGAPPLLQALATGNGAGPRNVEIAVERWSVDGSPFVTLHAHDTSERVERERELQCARDEISHLLDVRQELVNMLVHDLRSPITAIRFGADMLAADEDVPPDSREVAQHLVASADRLERLVDQVLVTARLESGTLELELQETDLRSVVEDVTEGVAAGQRERIVVADAPWPAVRVDRGLLHRVVENLVGNALKFSAAGQPVAVSCAPLADGSVRLSVADLGGGVPDAFKERVFDRFGVARHPDRAVRQTGLGLAFCRLAVEAHGGSIAVEDNTPHGAVFVVVLPGA